MFPGLPVEATSGTMTVADLRRYIREKGGLGEQTVAELDRSFAMLKIALDHQNLPKADADWSLLFRNPELRALIRRTAERVLEQRQQAAIAAGIPLPASDGNATLAVPNLDDPLGFRR